MLIQALGQGCAFLTSIILARHISIENYGHYIFGVTIASILAVISTMGAGGILARTWGRSELTDSLARDKETFSVYNWYFYRGITIILSIISIFYLMFFFNKDINYIEIITISFAIPFFIANILQSFYVAKRLVVKANTIQLGMRIIMLSLACVFVVFTINSTIYLVSLMLIAMSIYMITIAIKNQSKHGFKQIKPIGSNLSFALMQWGLLLLSQVDILILKVISSSDKIALYGVAIQLSALVAFVLNAVNANVLSHIADDYKNNTREVFQQKITYYTKIIFGLSFIAIVGLLVLGYPITLLYGQKFITSYYIFCILMLGQFVNIASGCVASILNMAGFEKNTCVAFYVALVINVFFGIILTLYYGIYGLAVASSISMAYWNLHLVYQVLKKIRINPTIFYRKSRREMKLY